MVSVFEFEYQASLEKFVPKSQKVLCWWKLNLWVAFTLYHTSQWNGALQNVYRMELLFILETLVLEQSLLHSRTAPLRCWKWNVLYPTSNPGILTIFHPAVSTREDYPGTWGHFSCRILKMGLGVVVFPALVVSPTREFRSVDWNSTCFPGRSICVITNMYV